MPEWRCSLLGKWGRDYFLISPGLPTGLIITLRPKTFSTSSLNFSLPVIPPLLTLSLISFHSPSGITSWKNFLYLSWRKGEIGMWGVRSLKLAFCGSWGWRRGAILLSCFLVKLAVWFFASVILLFRTVWVVSPSRISSLRSSGLGYASSPKHSHLLPCLQIFTLIHSSWKSTDVSKEANLSFLFSSRKANLACSRFFTASA